jgi:hypothetical protein
MSYFNVSVSIVNPREAYVRDRLVNARGAGFYEKHILARRAYLWLTPVSFATHAIDTAIGVVSGAAAVISEAVVVARGDVIFADSIPATINKFAHYHLSSSKWLLAGPYTSLLKAINVTAVVNPKMHGIIAGYVISFLNQTAQNCTASNNPFTREVTSRLTYVLVAISALVTRAGDGVLGVIAAVFSLCTAGYFESANSYAYRGLGAASIINDLFCCAVKFIDPRNEDMEFFGRVGGSSFLI